MTCPGNFFQIGLESGILMNRPRFLNQPRLEFSGRMKKQRFTEEQITGAVRSLCGAAANVCLLGGRGPC